MLVNRKRVDGSDIVVRSPSLTDIASLRPVKKTRNKQLAKNPILSPADAIRAAETNKSRWQKAVDRFGICSEVSNIGIVIAMAGKWLPALVEAGGSALSTTAFLTDPLIYIFKSLVRLTRIIGREFFGITFEEEIHGRHKLQTAADIASLVLFTLAIALFFGAIITSPVGITAAWALALSGLSIVGYFDYFHQANLAEKNWKASIILKGEEHEDTQILHKDYITRRNSARLFMALLLGLTFLLVCGSAAVFAPPALVPILFIASKVASAYLGCIAVARLTNWLLSGTSKKKEDKNEINLAVTTEASLSTTALLMSESPSLRLSTENSNISTAPLTDKGSNSVTLYNSREQTSLQVPKFFTSHKASSQSSNVLISCDKSRDLTQEIYLA